MKTMNIQLPSFGGFYDSIWYDSDNLCSELDYFEDNLEYGMHLDHIGDWGVSAQYEQDVCKAYTEYMQDQYRKLGIDITLKYECMTSPREYNFTTDKIYADMTWDGRKNLEGKLIVLMEKHKEQLSRIISRNHSSRDGFISFMDNTYDEWYERIAGMREESGDIDLYVGHLLAYLVMCENGWEHLYDLDEDAHYDVAEWRGIDMYMYLEPQSDEAKEEYEKYLAKVEYKHMLERDQLSFNFTYA